MRRLALHQRFCRCRFDRQGLDWAARPGFFMRGFRALIESPESTDIRIEGEETMVNPDFVWVGCEQRHFMRSPMKEANVFPHLYNRRDPLYLQRWCHVSQPKIREI